MPSRAWRATGALVLGLTFVFPLTLDRYRREPLHARRDGPFVATFVRESQRTARQLRAGRVVEWDLERLGYEWGVDDPGGARRMRWFLREGWGDSPHYGYGAARMRSGAAVLILPLFEPAPIRIELGLSTGSSTRVRLILNGTRLESRAPSGEDGVASWDLPTAHLFRGDNRIGLLKETGGPDGPSLRYVRLVPAG